MTILNTIKARACATVADGTAGNINVTSPPATLDGVTLVSGDSVVLPLQTNNAEQLVWVYNGPGNALTVDPDCGSNPGPGNRVWVTEGLAMRQAELVQLAVDDSLLWKERGRLMKDVFAGSLSLDGNLHALIGASGFELWTPSLKSSGAGSGLTYSTSAPPGGFCYFYGDLQILFADLTLTSKGTMGAGDAVLINPPYPVAAGEIQHAAGVAMVTGGLTRNVTGIYIGGSGLGFEDSNGPDSFLSWGDLTPNVRFRFLAITKR